MLFAATLVPPASASATVPPACPWSVSTVASGLGSLENLGFDATGGMLLSRKVGNAGQLYRLAPDGSGIAVVSNLDSPGAITTVGQAAYFTTGNSFASGVLGKDDGTIASVDIATGALVTVANGLTMPNGMARLPGGDFVVSRNLGLRTGLTRVRADGSQLQAFAPSLQHTNGVFYDSSRNAIITSLDFSPAITLALIDIDDTTKIRRINLGLFGLLGFPDDLTVGTDRRIYLAMAGGSIVRIDPEQGTACRLATSLSQATSVRFGSDSGWDARSLYVTSLDGSIHRLTPPPTA